MKIQLLIIFVLLLTSLSAQNKSIDFEIDHVNVAVKVINHAKSHFNQTLDFSIKPGRRHNNAIRNMHIRFPDNSGIELLSVFKPSDELSKKYHSIIEEKPGGSGVYLSLRVKTQDDFDKLENIVKKAKIKYEKNDFNYALILSFNDDTDLNKIFFIYYKRKPIDSNIYLRHKNTAFSMNSVWMEIKNPESLAKKLKILGIKSEKVDNTPFSKLSGYKINISGKSVFFTNSQDSNQLLGVGISVKNISKIKTILYKNRIRIRNQSLVQTDRKSILVGPKDNYGIWIEFSQM